MFTRGFHGQSFPFSSHPLHSLQKTLWVHCNIEEAKGELRNKSHKTELTTNNCMPKEAALFFPDL